MVYKLALLLTLGAGVILGGACQPKECPAQNDSYRLALIALFDADRTRCVETEGQDYTRAQELFQIAGASAASAFRAVAKECLPE